MSDDVLNKLAREILMVDKNGDSLLDEYKRIIEQGLPDSSTGGDKKDILII